MAEVNDPTADDLIACDSVHPARAGARVAIFAFVVSEEEIEALAHYLSHFQN